MMIVMSMALMACQSSKEVDTTVLKNYLDNLKTANYEEAAKNLESVPENFAYKNYGVMNLLFSKMNYEIKETKATKDGAEVKVSITIPNTVIIYDDMMNNMGEEIQKLQAGDDAGKTKASNMMIEFLTNKISESDVEMVENTVTVTLKTVGEKTVIVPEDSLSKALSGIPQKKK